MKRIEPEVIARILGATHLLGCLPDSELQELAGVNRQKSFAADDAIFRKGMPGDSMHLLVSGRVKLTAAGPTGTEVILGLVEPGELFGEIAAIDGKPRTVNAIATRTSSAASFERRFLLPVLNRNPSAAQALSEVLCGHLRTAIANLEKIALLDSQTRLWMRLLDLGARYSTESHGGEGPLRIEHGLSQQSLAESVGLTRVIVNRQLSRWREAGLTDHGRGFVVIPDPKALEAAVTRRAPIELRAEAPMAAE